MPAKKKLPHPKVMATRHDTLFRVTDGIAYAFDSERLKMLANALEVISNLTGNPPSKVRDEWYETEQVIVEGEAERIARRFDIPLPPRRISKAPPIEKWERDLAFVYDTVSFGAIEQEFPGVFEWESKYLSTDFPELTYRPKHRLHPRLHVLANFKEKYQASHRYRLNLENPRDRELVLTLARAIDRNARSKKGRAAYDQHVRHVSDSKTSAHEFADHLIAKYRELQVVHLILAYKAKTVIGESIPIDYETAKSHWEKFRRLLGKLPCAYLGKIAHSQTRSYYFHLVLFFSADTSAEKILAEVKEISPEHQSISIPGASLSTDVALGGLMGEVWRALSPKGEEIAPPNIRQRMAEGHIGHVYNINALDTSSSGLGRLKLSEKRKLKTFKEEVLDHIFGIDLYVRFIPPKKTSTSARQFRTYWKGGDRRIPFSIPPKRGRPKKQDASSPQAVAGEKPDETN